MIAVSAPKVRPQKLALANTTIAWSCGIPVITTPVGIASNIDNQIAKTIEIDNETELANAIIDFIDEKLTFNKEKILQFSQQFSEKSVLEKYNLLINQYLEIESHL